MKHTICHNVRSEIDEKDLTESLGAISVEHLRECSDCREFQNKQTKLRQIVGSLEPVNAPPDFDFKLRARLANANGGASHLLASPVRVWRLRSLAVAAMLLIFAATVVMIRQTDRSPQQAADSGQPPNLVNSNSGSRQEDEAPIPSPVKQADQQDNARAVAEQKPGPRRIVTQLPVNRRSPVAIDFGSRAAPVVRGQQSLATMTTFPLEVSQHSFTVSLDDGRGSSRIISVPAVSFGSRRVLTSGNSQSNQFAPKGDW